MDHTREMTRSQMAELNDLMKEIAAIDTEMTAAAPHKRTKLCLDMMENTSQIETLKEDTRCKIEALDSHHKVILARQLHALREITKVRGHAIDANNTNNCTYGTVGTTLEIPKHAIEEPVG
ncbi:hypothetical protein N7501_006001 [Penicillium viridicatum]|nr:hypothetical protein N7501_006001 [Penicillium viridicatum]